MNETRIAGTTGYHRIIRKESVAQLGQTSAVTQALEGARNEIQELLNIWGERPINIHVVVTVEPLTDSAGGPVVTRRAGGH